MTDTQNLSRRTFLQGGLALTLGFSRFASAGAASVARRGMRGVEYKSAEDLYRKKWVWDKIAYGSHSNACLPGSCLWHVYSRNGIVWREEQAAKHPYKNGNYPDFNPMGCQKGCGFSQVLHGSERIKYPLKRAGERGEGKWERVTWDQALGDIADAILDAHKTQGPDSVILDTPHIQTGTASTIGIFRLWRLLGGVQPDLNVSSSDCNIGIMHTFGKNFFAHSPDNVFDAELFIVTHCNPSYTLIPIYHFNTEARYNGTEMVVLSPEYVPHLYADLHIPLTGGSDAAFWLAVSQVMLEERLYEPNVQFVKEQTDLPILVRDDNGRFLREADLQDGGREKGLHFWDMATGKLVAAPRKTLDLGALNPALEGRYSVTLKDGSSITVRPVFEVLRQHLVEYTPEKVQAATGIHPSVIRAMARKVATKRTLVLIGFSSPKSYHCQLHERALLLAMGLSGNWGKPGTGFTIFSGPMDDFGLLPFLEKTVEDGGLQEFAGVAEGMYKTIYAKMAAEDPDITDEDVEREMTILGGSQIGAAQPSAWMYRHCGYDQLWDKREWLGQGETRTFGEALDEAVKRGWWRDMQIRPAKDVTPQVLCLVSSNPLRKLRSAMKLYPEVLFPKLKMIFTIEVRMSATAAFADIVLPAAWYYEKHDKSFNYLGNSGSVFLDRSSTAPGEAKPEWEIYALLAKKLGERAQARGVTEFTNFFGITRQYADLHDQFTFGGKVNTHEDVTAQAVQINTLGGAFPAGTTYEKFKKDGWAPYTSLAGATRMNANELDVNKPFYPLRWHIDQKKPYPTYARRAQFYLDHEWYIEAGEALPVFKDVPFIGGNHPFRLTGGHPRHSIHSLHQNNEFLMQLHRGQPVVHLNDEDAAALGIADGDRVVLFNDMGESEAMARLSPGVHRHQVISYMWESNLYKKWKAVDNMMVGMPKPLMWAGGYDQFFYYLWAGGPLPGSDRNIRVGVRKAV